MIRSLFRVFFAFVAACLAAGLVQVLFVTPPTEIAKIDSSMLLEKSGGLAWLVLLVATQSAFFSAPFALVAVALAEWQGLRNWIYYAVAGIAIAFAGFLVLHMGEDPNRTFMHDYALRAFLTTGLAAGFVYWLAGGRGAGGAAFDGDDTSGPSRQNRIMAPTRSDFGAT
ncbi:MAG: hypothetical protein ABL894_04260 [Hyphomicrobium sp.]